MMETSDKHTDSSKANQSTKARLAAESDANGSDLSSDTAPSLSIDWEAYLPYLENDDIPNNQKRELIETLWSIVLSFVDLGFDVQSSIGSNDEISKEMEDGLLDMLSSAQQSSETEAP